MSNITAQAIKEQARALGFDKVGIVAAEALSEEGARLQQWLEQNFHGAMGYMARDPQQRADPRLLLPSAKSVVCVALNYYRPEKHSEDPSIGKISRYAWGDDYHDVLRDKLKMLLAWIHETAPDTEAKICVDSTPMMDKAWAVRAGLGWLGKHTNVITKEFGSWVFLGELVLSVELEYDSYIEPDHCGKCRACLDACPTGAIIAPYQVDATRCISYGTIELREAALPEPINSNLENWVFGCDICQDVCPWSRFSKQTKEERFTPREGMIAPALTELAELRQEEFSTRFRRNPVKRAKLVSLRRNALAVIASNQKVVRHPTGKAMSKLNKLLSLPVYPGMQDWEFECSDSARVVEFCQLYMILTEDDERFALMALIISSLDDALRLPTIDEEGTALVSELLTADFNLHKDTIEYWCHWAEPHLSNCFDVTPMMRSIWNACPSKPKSD